MGRYYERPSCRLLRYWPAAPYFWSSDRSHAAFCCSEGSVLLLAASTSFTNNEVVARWTVNSCLKPKIKSPTTPTAALRTASTTLGSSDMSLMKKSTAFTCSLRRWSLFASRRPWMMPVYASKAPSRRLFKYSTHSSFPLGPSCNFVADASRNIFTTGGKYFSKSPVIARAMSPKQDIMAGLIFLSTAPFSRLPYKISKMVSQYVLIFRPRPLQRSPTTPVAMMQTCTSSYRWRPILK
mmetsp:Transcript_42709/g.117894  ORF Transcript_42709/g.117894 Transcript_42709/m.117894 type:complete len:238 (-) Transcript_42709:2173-2886(-)